MSYFADHLAWQQRVNQETKQQNATMDSFTSKSPATDVIEYLKNPSLGKNRTFGKYPPSKSYYVGGIVPSVGEQIVSGRYKRDQSTDDAANLKAQMFGKSETQSIYSYQGKKSQADTRSRRGNSMNPRGPTGLRDNAVGPYTDQEHKQNKVQNARFNEAIQTRSKYGTGGEKSVFSQQSRASKIYGKPNSQHPSVFGKPTFRDPQGNDIFTQYEQQRQMEEGGYQGSQPTAEEMEAMNAMRENPMDDDEGRIDSVSQVAPPDSKYSQLSGKTYISQLKKQLDEEREAREKIQGEMEDLKKASEEISSQLNYMKQEQN